MAVDWDAKLLDEATDLNFDFATLRDRALADPTKKNVESSAAIYRAILKIIEKMDKRTADVYMNSIYSMPRTFRPDTPEGADDLRKQLDLHARSIVQAAKNRAGRR